MYSSLRVVLRFTLLLATGFTTEAGVTRVEILDSRPFAEGTSYGAAGPYQRISGRLHLVVDPSDPANARIADLSLAPRNAERLVEFWSDFFLLVPAQPSKGNGCLIYDVNNRGNMLALGTFNGGERTNNPSTAAHAGNGFLMRHGYSVLWTGWNGEVIQDETHRLITELPIARINGQPVTGLAHLEISTTERVFSRAFSWSPWGVSAAYQAADPDHRQASLSMRPSRAEPGQPVPHDQWAFGRWENEQLIPDLTHLYVKEGFSPGWLYDLVYTAKEPRVTGLGMASLRDAVAFFRHAEKDDTGLPNPLAGVVRRALLFGISQSGRLAHHFIYEGFNSDPTGRAVFDGALIHVAGAGKGMFNHRFRLTTEYGTQHEGNFSGSECFPLAPVPQTDSVTGQKGDTLAAARASGFLPRIVFTQSSTEYWSRAASLLHTDVEGKTDLTLPDEVRIYHVAGSQHLGGTEATPGNSQQARNPLDDRGPILRALLLALDAWVSTDTPPPPSRYPRLEKGTLVTLETVRASFPSIPGLNLPTQHYQPLRLDFGPRFHTEGIADIVPPKAGAPFVTLLPAVDADGNEIDGVRLPEITVPLGTHSGWNLRAPATGAEQMLSALDGMFLPFARTRAEREQNGDPRPSIEERYPSHADYLSQITVAALQLHRDGFLLAEDLVTILNRAAAQPHWGKK